MSNILKRVLVGVAVGVILYLLKGYILMNVSARTISMSVPDNFGYYTTNGQSTQNTLTSQQATLNNYVNIPSYRSQLIPQNSHGGLAYEWTNANLCVNDDLTISGVVHNPTITSVTWASGYFNSWTEQKSCDLFSVSNGYRFTCSGTGGGGFVVYFGFQNDNAYGGYMYLERDMDIYCNATANDIISNANNNTTQIINNNNENTQNIINNQNENTEKEIESQKVCSHIDKTNVVVTNVALGSSGEYFSSNNYGVTDYIRLSSSDTLSVDIGFNVNSCFYTVNKTSISCFKPSVYNAGDTVSIPSNAYYFRASIQLTYNRPSFTLCRNGNQAIADGQQQLNDSLNNKDVTGSASDGSNFFLNFADPVNPLQDVLMFPINLFASASDSCSPISLTVLGSSFDIPCGDTLFWNNNVAGSSFITWWNMFFGGLSIYFLCLQLFHIISDSFDPFKDDLGKVRGI